MKASITVEAAITVPVMIFVMYVFLYSMKIMEAERKLFNYMEKTAETLSAAEYIKRTGNGYLKNGQKGKEGDGLSETIQKIIEGLEAGYGLGSILAEAYQGPFEDLYFSGDTAVFSSEEGANSAMFYAELIYKPEYPSLPVSFTVPEKSLVVNKRAWTGSDGGRGRSKYTDEILEEEEKDNRTVYLGKTSTVYHEDPNCHYLSNKMSTADASAMSGLRNESGGKYHACPSCRPGNSGTVYYFRDGTAYHSSEDCKSIAAYARAVSINEVEGMRGCSYCSGSHSGKEH